MSTLSIHNLPQSRELDREALTSIRGGNSWLRGLGPVANVNIAIDQNINQFQNVEVSALNNVGVIGAGFGPLSFDVSPGQFAQAVAKV
ncbi:hypothetical protein EDC30_10815 [Paucimonas lemoignei]|uniref:Uncharacterized protein n=1 Tax=Paucimonas lemoignei TaxID=29443 RepID=A0A4R3HSG5_PAULE|nr:hypothetical protein [Paucimonas lemoignei]TCS35952.1 hypothetical protein EDC30_10815 [Paucimonas lemoignei]